MEEQRLTYQQACQRLGFSAQRLYLLLKDGRLPRRHDPWSGRPFLLLADVAGFKRLKRGRKKLVR
jgi:hypothetical protein